MMRGGLGGGSRSPDPVGTDRGCRVRGEPRLDDPVRVVLQNREDEQVGDMVAASLNYQSLSEALSRHFGLMRLAVTGRS